VEKAEGYKIREVQSMKDDYIGMNPHAARQLHEPFKGNRRTVDVVSSLPKKEKKLTIQHEIDEDRIIARKKVKYKVAHKKATRLENLGLHRKIGSRPLGETIRLNENKRISSR
jgi:hypothetical protein